MRGLFRRTAPSGAQRKTLATRDASAPDGAPRSADARAVSALSVVLRHLLKSTAERLPGHSNETVGAFEPLEKLLLHVVLYRVHAVLSVGRPGSRGFESSDVRIESSLVQAQSFEHFWFRQFLSQLVEFFAQASDLLSQFIDLILKNTRCAIGHDAPAF